MAALWQDVRYAFRLFWHRPGFTAMVLLILALGTGANTAIFTVVEAALLRPLPYPHPERLVELSERSRGELIPVAYPNFLDWRRQAGAFEHMSVVATGSVSLADQAGARLIPSALVSASFLDVLGVRPALGRAFREAEDQAGAPLTAVVTRGFWQREMSADPAPLGKTLRLNGRSCTVVGVLPPEFHFHRDAEVFLPMAAVLGRMLDARNNHSDMTVLARLRPGVTPEQARAQIETVAARLERQYPDSNSGIGASLMLLRERISGESRKPLLVLWGAVSLLLVAACANIANLLLARSSLRRRELAIRAALGAGPRALFRQLFVESLILALAGTGLGLISLLWTQKAAGMLLPAGVAPARVDWTVLFYSLLAAVLCAMVFGLAPAWRAARAQISELIKAGGQAGRRREGWLRDGLVVGEVAISVALLAGAGLLARSMHRLLGLQLGFESESVVSAELRNPHAFDFGRSQVFFDQVVEGARTIPGVEAAAAATNLALAGGRSSVEVYPAARPVPARGAFPSVPYQIVSPGYFRTLGIPLRRGRFFDGRDRGPGIRPGMDPEQVFGMLSKTQMAAVISQGMADRLWPGEDPVGRRFHFGTPEMHGPVLEVIGVAADTRHDQLEAEPEPSWYLCSAQFPLMNGSTHLVLRSRRPIPGLAVEVRRIVAAADPEVPVASVRAVEEIREGVLADRRLRTVLLEAFAGLALALSLAGIYSVISYSVAQRRREFGVRMATGADGGHLVRLVLREGARRVAAGLLCGLAGAVALTRLLRGMLFGVEPGDPLTLAAVALLLAAAALAAMWVPARRAARVDPLEALRCD